MMNKQPGPYYCFWLATAIGKKTPLAYYDCPHCSANIATLIPPNGDVWDTFATCPYCDGMYLKVVKNIEFVPVVEITKMPEVTGD